MSLLELLVVIALLGLFLGAVYETTLAGLRVTQSAQDREGLRAELAASLDRLTREAGLASRVEFAEDHRLEFDADLDGDGTAEQDIGYELQSGELRRVSPGANLTLARHLTVLDFDYIDLNGSAMATPVIGSARDEIRVMHVTVTGDHQGERVSLTSAAFLRNNQ